MFYGQDYSAKFLVCERLQDRETFCVSVHTVVRGESYALPHFGPKLLISSLMADKYVQEA